MLFRSQQELHRSPTVSEVAARTGCSSEQVLEAIEASNAFRAASLDTPSTHETSNAPTEHASLSAQSDFDVAEAKQTIEQLLPVLSPRTRRIVELRYYDNLSQSEIATLVGISQMHVSRLLRQALDHMAKTATAGEAKDK